MPGRGPTKPGSRPPPKRTKLGVGELGERQTLRTQGSPPPRQGPELIGTMVLHRYLVEEELGAGAMGTVYRGTHVKLKRPVAIKVLHDHLVHEPTMVARFHREARVAARLRHANVVSVLDVGETGGKQIMVMELVVGPSLEDLMTTPLARERLVGVVTQLLHGLEHAHAAGLVHRDLKPANVIVEHADDGTEVPRIVDFGIAILLNSEEPLEGGRLTTSGVILGTPLYMSPEQAKGEAFDHRADLFALGVMIYEMIAGMPPFDGSAIEVAIANATRDPPPIAQRAPGTVVDPVLEAFARRLMARQPASRFASAREALAMLELVERDPDAAAVALGITDAAKATTVVTLSSPPPRKRR